MNLLLYIHANKGNEIPMDLNAKRLFNFDSMLFSEKKIINNQCAMFNTHFCRRLQLNIECCILNIECLNLK